MKRILSIVCIMWAALASFGQTTRWTDVTYANDTLVEHKLDIYLQTAIGRSIRSLC